jgi:hypothetical protein
VIEGISWIESSSKIFVTVILICYCSYQIFVIFHNFERFISCLYVTIWLEFWGRDKIQVLMLRKCCEWRLRTTRWYCVTNTVQGWYELPTSRRHTHKLLKIRTVVLIIYLIEFVSGILFNITRNSNFISTVNLSSICRYDTHCDNFNFKNCLPHL